MDEPIQALRITPKGIVYVTLLNANITPGDLPERILEALGIRAKKFAGQGNIAGMVWVNGKWEWVTLDKKI